MSRRGFTLIEVLIAMLILAGAMVALSQAWTGSIFAFRKSQNLGTIVGLLKKKTAELEIKYKDLSFSEIPEEDAGDFGSDYSDFSWEAKTQDLEFPDLSAALTSQEGGANELVLTVVKQMTEFFSKNTKELRVTVNWKIGEKVVKYSITTYLTNRPKESGITPPPTPTGTTPAPGGNP